MSRSGYCEDGEDAWAFVRWRGAVKNAIAGRRMAKITITIEVSESNMHTIIIDKRRIR